MEKRKMLTFSISAQLIIETAASAFLLFCAWRLVSGIMDSSQTQTGRFILLFFTLAFGVGGVLGFVKCVRKYKNYRKSDVKHRP